MDQVDEVKQKTDIVSVIGERVELKKAGSNFRGLCPFHGEKTPSFMVSPELQIYKCFGCGESGDVISFLQKYEGMDFWEAMKFLADKAGVELKSITGDKLGKKEKLIALNNLVSRFYSYMLLEKDLGKKAYIYLTEKRGLKLETIKTFKIGFSPRESGILVNFLTKKKGYGVSELLDSGIFYKYAGRLSDRFSGRVIFPIHDPRGNTIGFSGRVLPQTKTNMGKYINSPETVCYKKSYVLFGLHASKNEIKKQKTAILVEGDLDMISSFQGGVINVVSVKGTSLTEGQVKLLSRFAEKVVFAFDSDSAGSIASKRGVAIAQKEGLEVMVADLKGYKDPDDMVRANPMLFKKTIENAVGAWDFLIGLPFKIYDVKTGGGKQKIAREVTSTLSSIPDKIVQAHYIEIAAKKLSVPPQVVYDSVSGIKVNIRSEENTENVSEQKTRRHRLEEELASLLIRTDMKRLFEKEIKDFFTTPLLKKIIKEVGKYTINKQDFDPKVFAKKVSPELFDGFSNLMLMDLGDIDSVKEGKKQIEEVVRELRVLNIRQNLAKIAQNIKEFEQAGEEEKLHDAQKQFQSLSSELNSLRNE